MERVTIGGVEYYRLSEHFVLPSGRGIKLIPCKDAADGVEAYLAAEIKKDAEEAASLAAYAAKRAAEENAAAVAKAEREAARLSFRREKNSKLLSEVSNLEEGQAINVDSLSCCLVDINPNLTNVVRIKKSDGRIIAITCYSYVSGKGYSRGTVYSSPEREVDITSLVVFVVNEGRHD